MARIDSYEASCRSEVEWVVSWAQAGGPVLFMWLRQARGWRAPWLLAAAVTASYVGVAVATRVAVKLPPDTFMAAPPLERRVFGSAPPLGQQDKGPA